MRRQTVSTHLINHFTELSINSLAILIIWFLGGCFEPGPAMGTEELSLILIQVKFHDALF